MAHDGQFPEIDVASYFHVLLDGCIGLADDYRLDELVFAPRVLKAQAKLPVAGVKVEGQSAALSGCVDIRCQTEGLFLPVQVERMLEKK